MISITKQEVPKALNQSTDDDIVLSVDHVSKRFCRDLKRSLFYGIQDITADLIGIREASAQLRPKEFLALDNVSFQLRRGEALGLVGKNGSGKSTLLRIITGLIKPDSGSVQVKGRVAPLIALGAGFNPILSGRENIYTNMSILGLSKQEIDERFDEVVEFSEIGDAIDAPVQSYSSGMAARLGFSSAIHTKPDILLIDEVLAVGDMKFRSKCYRKLANLRKEGTTFILVAHDPNIILTVCDSAVYIKKGAVMASGEAYEIMRHYEADLFEREAHQSTGKLFLPEKTKDQSTGLDIQYLLFKDIDGNSIEAPTTGEPINLCIGCKVHEQLKDIDVNLLIQEKSGSGERVLRLDISSDRKLVNLAPGEHEIRLKMPYVCLKPGSYTIKLSLNLPNLYMLDAVESFSFRIETIQNMTQCLFYQPRSWQIINK